MRVIQKIADDFYFIERGWLNGNHFVFNGKNKVLIDTGYKKTFNTPWTSSGRPAWSLRRWS